MADDPTQSPSDSTQIPKVAPPILPQLDDQDENGSGNFQTMYGQGGKFKEGIDKFVAGRTGGVETEPQSVGGERVEEVVEIPTQVELEKKPELAGYMERIEKEVELQSTVTDDYTGQVLMKPAQQDTTVTLPLTESQVKDGLHHQIWDSIRWLAEWCVRQIKMLHGKVRYKSSEQPKS